MKIEDLRPEVGSRKAKVRIGRGIGSGCGKTSGRGHKGQKARSGGGVRPGFEGGQMPIYRRLPKRGFKNIGRRDYAQINISKFEVFEDGSQVDAILLLESGIIKDVCDGLKVLGGGSLTKRLVVKAQGFSKGAIAKIEACGGRAEVI